MKRLAREHAVKVADGCFSTVEEAKYKALRFVGVESGFLPETRDRLSLAVALGKEYLMDVEFFKDVFLPYALRGSLESKVVRKALHLCGNAPRSLNVSRFWDVFDLLRLVKDTSSLTSVIGPVLENKHNMKRFADKYPKVKAVAELELGAGDPQTFLYEVNIAPLVEKKVSVYFYSASMDARGTTLQFEDNANAQVVFLKSMADSPPARNVVSVAFERLLFLEVDPSTPLFEDGLVACRAWLTSWGLRTLKLARCNRQSDHQRLAIYKRTCKFVSSLKIIGLNNVEVVLRART